MGSLVLCMSMSMSLDGFIAGPGDSKGNPFGTKGHRLHEWLGDGGEDLSGFRPGDEPSQTVFAEMMSTGAVITGRRTGDFVGYWGGDHHDGVPIFVPTHRVPASMPPGDVRFVTDGIESCAGQAKAAAGDRDVMLHGAYTARECLRARAGRAGDPAGPGPVRPGTTVLRHSRARPHRTRAGPGARVAQRSAPSLRGAVRVNPPIRP